MNLIFLSCKYSKSSSVQNLELCYAYCSDNSQETLTLKLIEENSTIITLVCRDSTSLILNITNSFVEKDFTRVENTRIPTAAESIDGHSSNSTASNQTDVRFVYLIKIQEGNNELAARIIYMVSTEQGLILMRSSDPWCPCFFILYSYAS